MKEQIAEIFSTLFDMEISVDSNISMDNNEEWTSIKHIEIIVTLEDELGVKFKTGDIPKMTSLKKIIEYLEDNSND